MNKEDKNESYITLGDIFYSLKKNLVLIAIITLAITILGSIYTFGITKEKYQSSTTLIVSLEDKNSEVDLNNSLRLITTVANLVTEDIVLEKVAAQYVNPDDELAIDKYILEMKENIKVTSSSSSFLITISVTNTDRNLTKEQANLIANSVIEVCNDSNSSVSNLLSNSISQTSQATIGRYVSPNKPLYLIISLVGGVVVGCIAALCLELLSTKFKNKKDIEYVTSEPIIGELFYNKNGSLDLSKEITKLADIEPFNRVFTNIKYLNSIKNVRTIMTTSTTSGELKSTLNSGLALSIAKYNKKVIIIDLDLRLPTLHKLFKLEKANGIIDYISGDLKYEDIIKHTPNGIDVITSGVAPSYVNPAIFIESPKLNELVSKLKEEYEYILFDVPPILPCNDALMLAPKVDGVIYNVAIDRARKKDFKDCLNRLKNTDSDLLGLCATNLKISKKEASNYYYYSEDKKR